MSENVPLKYLATPKFLGSHEERIAYKHSDGAGPTVVWCGGLKSDMEGGKATYLHRWANARGQAYVRFDYYGHGQSSGAFKDGTISRWTADTLSIIDQLTQGDLVLVGSSMGGWTALNAALARSERVKALALIAPAPDFTEKLMWKNFTDAQKHTLKTEGILYVPSDYDEPYEYSWGLIEDGRKNLLLDGHIAFNGPVRILQGQQDTAVPWEHAMRVVDALASDAVEFTLVKDGDHSLSRPQDLTRLAYTLEHLCQTI